jgi:hypothetical protein
VGLLCGPYRQGRGRAGDGDQRLPGAARRLAHAGRAGGCDGPGGVPRARLPRAGGSIRVLCPSA